MASLGGIQCGITYENGQPGDDLNQTGIDVFGWTLCATLEFPTPGPNAWPRPGGGNLITWLNCDPGQLSVAGFFYVAAYGPDEMRITVRPVDERAKVATCEAFEVEIPQSGLGYASFAAVRVSGCNPCLAPCDLQPTMVRPTTWSGIKTLYRSGAGAP